MTRKREETKERKREEETRTLALSVPVSFCKKQKMRQNARHRDPGVKPLRVEEAEEQIRGAAVGGGGSGG